jgi:hypothetical protein
MALRNMLFTTSIVHLYLKSQPRSSYKKKIVIIVQHHSHVQKMLVFGSACQSFIAIALCQVDDMKLAYFLTHSCCHISFHLNLHYWMNNPLISTFYFFQTSTINNHFLAYDQKAKYLYSIFI